MNAADPAITAAVQWMENDHLAGLYATLLYNELHGLYIDFAAELRIDAASWERKKAMTNGLLEHGIITTDAEKHMYVLTATGEAAVEDCLRRTKLFT